MSAKYFCDGCGEELAIELEPTITSSRLRSTVTNPMIEVTTGKNGSWNHGHWCRKCIVGAVERAWQNELNTPKEEK